jgi:hypothetical protein
MNYNVHIRFVLDGEFSHTESYDVEVADGTAEDEDNLMEALMDSAREMLADEFEGDEDWENGNYNWTIYDYEKN